MSGNRSFTHQNAGVVTVQAIEPPEVVTSAWIDEQLAET